MDRSGHLGKMSERGVTAEDTLLIGATGRRQKSTGCRVEAAGAVRVDAHAGDWASAGRARMCTLEPSE